MRRSLLIIVTLSLAFAPWGLGDAVEQSGVIPDSLLRDSSAQELREVIGGLPMWMRRKGQSSGATGRSTNIF